MRTTCNSPHNTTMKVGYQWLRSVHLEIIQKRLRGPCVTVTQKWVDELLLRAPLQTMKIPLHKTCVTFTQKKVVKSYLESKTKLYNSLDNIIMRSGHQQLLKKSKMEFPFGNKQEIIGISCNIYTRRVEQFHWTKE